FVLAALCASPAVAADAQWKGIVGVITAPDDLTTDAAEDINNPVCNVDSGTVPWSCQARDAHVDLPIVAADFVVHGLVVNGQARIGTPGPVQTITGTLVCNPGTQTEMPLDTSDIPIDRQGTARFSGVINGIPAACMNPVFLVRIATIANPQNPNLA